jgi:uncharacterized membrane protein
MKMQVRDLAFLSIFAALYAVLVVALAGISFQLVQVRIADALIPLSIVFGWPVAVGVAVGAAVANIASPMPVVIVDVVFGSVANFIASLLAWRLGRFKLVSNVVGEVLGCIAATLAVTLIVGTYLAVLTEMELWVWWLGVGAGSVISICFIGFPLVQVLKRIGHKPSVT